MDAEVIRSGGGLGLRIRSAVAAPVRAGAAAFTRLLAVLPACVIVLGCAAAPPLKIAGADRTLTPEAAVQSVPVPSGARVVWGGVIVAGANLEERTQLEVLAYPLDARDRPDIDAKPLGRFLAEKGGYLETATYSRGRSLTVVGSLLGTRQGVIGEAPYTYAVIAVEQIHLWPRSGQYLETPRVHFGIGVILH